MLFAILLTVASFAADPAEDDINICARNSDCVVVPYRHCCGSSKRAINKKFLSLYEARPDWQKYDRPDCNLMGMCPPDKKVKTAVCAGDQPKRCSLTPD